VMYTRESRYDAALNVVDHLQREYPRNRLLWLEGGSTALRAGRAADARRQLEVGLTKLAADPRPRAFGEDARWRLTYGTALAALNDAAHAQRELRAALDTPADDWVRGRAHHELGRLAERGGDRSRAVIEYREAARLCAADDDDTCANDAKRGAARALRP